MVGAPRRKCAKSCAPPFATEPRKTEPLGKRLRALFGDIGLEEDIPEWRGQPAEPAKF